ncbi:MAG TPA: hypothetical protein VKU19_24640 [Bryobacteraceae bacterium]|nr:hypothetical protein [Bryobacteraceae bacterium]
MAELRSCIVSYKDLDGITHSIEVTAESLYEAAILGLAAMKVPRWRDSPWLQINVQAKSPATTHLVEHTMLTSWLDRNGRTPREQALKVRLRELVRG